MVWRLRSRSSASQEAEVLTQAGQQIPRGGRRGRAFGSTGLPSKADRVWRWSATQGSTWLRQVVLLGEDEKHPDSEHFANGERPFPGKWVAGTGGHSNRFAEVDALQIGPRSTACRSATVSMHTRCGCVVFIRPFYEPDQFRKG